MSLDALTRQQLAEAKQAIIAQLDELEFRCSGRSWHRRSAKDGGDAYDQLKDELWQINELLGLDGADGL